MLLLRQSGKVVQLTRGEQSINLLLLNSSSLIFGAQERRVKEMNKHDTCHRNSASRSYSVKQKRMRLTDASTDRNDIKTYSDVSSANLL
jgi:hypothetical protein